MQFIRDSVWMSEPRSAYHQDLLGLQWRQDAHISTHQFGGI